MPDLTPQQRQDFLADPLGNAAPLLGRATTRIVYDLDRYRTTQQPVFAATLARETHASDPLPPGGLKVQVSLSYSDGFGREIQKKIQAEPGPIVDGGPRIAPRWVGSGWTIFNNKGKPVQQYEPFFDDTHDFEFANAASASARSLFYDPVERVVATLHPNHTWEKVVFDPWRQETWDVNDTVLIADPKTDAGCRRILPTPAGRGLSADLVCAARGGGARARSGTGCRGQGGGHMRHPVGSPCRLARPNLPHHRAQQVRAQRHDGGGKYATRVELDIEGNQREVIDAKDRIVMRYDYDMLGTRIHQASMEAGERWMLNDVAGKPIYAWDSRDHQFRTAYDPLRRPIDFLRKAQNRSILIGRTVYGETQPNPEAKQPARQGGSALRSGRRGHQRRLRLQGKSASQPAPVGARVQGDARLVTIPSCRLNRRSSRSSTPYDALNRPTQ